MFDNLTKEIILLSVIPVAIILIVDFIALILKRKDNEKFKYNYFIKVSLIIAIAFVLPLIGGYDIWLIISYKERDILTENIWYIGLIIFLWLMLLILLIWTYLKTMKEIKEDNKEKEKMENE